MTVEAVQIDPLRYLAPLPHAIKEFSGNEREILQSVNRKVGAAQSLDEVVSFLLESTRSICPCDRIALALLEDDGHHLVSRCARALYEPVLLGKGYAEDMANGSLQAVIERGTPRIISDLPEYLREKPNSRSSALLVREGVRSSMTCPLVVDGRNVGLLFRSSRRAHAYGEHQMRLHLAIAQQLSQTVEKAYRIEQLTQAKRDYLEMLGFVSHELRNPIVSLMSNAGLLADGALPPAENARSPVEESTKLGAVERRPQETERLDREPAIEDHPHDVEHTAVDAPTAGQTRPKVLCIDDDPDFSRSISIRLRQYGVDVIRAFSGMQGYWMGLDDRPDVILVDLNMPDAEGNYIFSRFKARPLTEGVPVIVITSNVNPGTKRQMLSIGVDAYITKPLVFDELLRELRSHIDMPQRPTPVNVPVPPYYASSSEFVGAMPA